MNDLIKKKKYLNQVKIMNMNLNLQKNRINKINAIQNIKSKQLIKYSFKKNIIINLLSVYFKSKKKKNMNIIIQSNKKKINMKNIFNYKKNYPIKKQKKDT